MKRRALAALPLLLAVAGRALGQDASTPGTVTTPFPTLENASVEWALTGDDDLDATVAVRFREVGGTFRDGQPLVRVPAGTNEGFSWENRFAGSLFGLTPGTDYELELTLTDPDGGSTTRTVTVTTRSMPVAAGDAREVPVDPESIDAALDAAEPGDVLLLAAGTYAELTVPNDGAPGRPIVLRGAATGAAVVEGDVRMDGRSHVIVEGLTVHGKFKFNDAFFITVRGCTIDTPDDGIVSFGDGVENAVIVDNVITGPTVWMESALGVDGDNLGEGVQLTGAGNVVAHNRVTGFRDCLSLLEDDEAVNQISNDFYGNDLDNCADDAVEADFAMGNVRVYRNRIARSFMGLSSQPSLGGPTYFFRNVMYGIVFQAFKLQRGSVGDLGFHNTVVKSGDAFSVNTEDPISRAFFRNNLFLGGPGGDYNGFDSGPGDVIALDTADDTCSFDYDGYGSIGTGAFEGRLGDVRFTSLAELTAGTTEAHAVEVDLGAFSPAVEFPEDPFAPPPFPPLTLAASGGAVDLGVVLPNLNDGFDGSAPDLGAYELGEQPPTYGPTGGGGAPTAGTGGTSSGEGGEMSVTGGTGTGGASGAGAGRGGVAAGGSPASGGSTSGGGGQAGSSSAGTASGGTSGLGGATASGGAPGSDEEGGCGCRVAGGSADSERGAVAALVVLGLSLARRRRGRARVS
jgi:MYXO-CTERM domain-containing protein